MAGETSQLGRGFGPARVLIVDDNIALAENIAEALGLEGYETDIAASAEEALPKALTGEVAAMVTDYRLPGIDGAELAERVQRAGKEVLLIVISGHTDETTVGRARKAGARFFPKPVDIEALTSHIRASR